MPPAVGVGPVRRDGTSFRVDSPYIEIDGVDMSAWVHSIEVTLGDMEPTEFHMDWSQYE